MTVPPEAIIVAAVAIHDGECSDHTCNGEALGPFYAKARRALEAAAPLIAAAERERIYAQLGNDHFVIFTKDRWTVEHSVECRLSGQMHECEYHSAVQRDPDDARARAGYGRFCLAVDEDGWPQLERADLIGGTS